MLKQELVFGEFLKERRNQLRLTVSQLASDIGYRNINKGIRRITAVESGHIDSELVAKLMMHLQVTQEDRDRCLNLEATARKLLIEKMPKFKPVIVWRAMPCIYVPVNLPEGLTEQQDMIAYAAEFSRERHGHCCLKLDYDLRYWINERGETGNADRTISNLPDVKPNLVKLLSNC